MIRYITVREVVALHGQIIERTGGSPGLRDGGALQSAVAQPRATYAQQELYPTISDKAAALGFSLIMNHPFVDGNKRIGHAAMEVFLLLNGFELKASTDEQEDIILQVASGATCRDAFRQWVHDRIVVHPRPINNN